MLPKNPAEELTSVTFEKYGTGERAGENLTRFGAFAWGERVSLRVSCPRRLGVTAVVLRINRDGEAPGDIPFTFLGSDYEQGQDVCTLELDTAALCGQDTGGRRSGLFYYRLLLVRDRDTLFTDSRNNVDFTLGADGGQAFRLLVYDSRDPVPDWFGQGVLYHVFVDRFRRGAGTVSYPTGARGAVMEPDWANGIPPFAENPGDSLANNTFFGGNLWGVAEKLEYLAELGVRVLYLSPIFRAYSNHKYDTGDYLAVDEGFGGEAALDGLLDKANRLGIAVMLDGVFNHTGDDSRYFNRYGTYPDVGAYQSPDSPYRDWYEFSAWPDGYASWWGIPIMPKLNHRHDDCRRFFTGADGVGARYIRRGISGWRLDVADELPDVFLDEFHAAVRAAGAERGCRPVIIGEVWENAADKTAYGRRRRYLQGGQLDSVMNYPVRSGILSFICERDAEMLYDVLTELYASYPRPVSDSLMNLLGTHDTERILTVLGSGPSDYDRPNRVLSVARLSPEKRRTAAHLLKLASLLQYTVFGIPSLYYGDEVGLEGYHDPFCRMPFPWDGLDEPVRADLLTHYRALGALRAHPALNRGGFRFAGHGADWIAFRRFADGAGAGDSDCAGDGADAGTGTGDLLIAVSRSTFPVELTLPPDASLLLSVGGAAVSAGRLALPPDSGCVVQLGNA